MTEIEKAAIYDLIMEVGLIGNRRLELQKAGQPIPANYDDRPKRITVKLLSMDHENPDAFITGLIDIGTNLGFITKKNLRSFVLSRAPQPQMQRATTTADQGSTEERVNDEGDG